MINLSDGSQFNFNARKLDVSLERDIDGPSFDSNDVTSFVENVSDLEAICRMNLGIEEAGLTRAGFRIWFLFPEESIAASESLRSQLGLYQYDEEISQQFGEVEQTTFSATMSGDEFSYRISFAPVEQVAPTKIGSSLQRFDKQNMNSRTREYFEEHKKDLNEQRKFALMIDVDVSTEVFEEFDTSQFCHRAYSDTVTKLENVLKKNK